MNARTTGTDPGSKSARELEREVQESRADVERTLDAIQERLSPGQLLDQAVGYFRGGRGADFARNLGDSVAANPIPVTLMGVGLAWMMLSGQRSSGEGGRAAPGYWDEDLDEYEDRYTGFAEENVAYLGPDTEPESFGSFGEGARPEEGAGFGEGATGRSAKDRLDEIGGRAREAGERARERAERARERVGRAGERIGRAGSSLGAGMADRAHEARLQARRYGRRARQGMLRSLDEQPLLLGAIGLAIGAALGAALPRSETEDELMGEARDKVLRRATKAGREQAEKARDAAGAVAAAAREEAGRQGLTPDRSRERGGTTPDQPSGVTAASQPTGAAVTQPGGGAAGKVQPGESRSVPPASDTPYPADPKASLDRS